jgi:hypothetical protein
VEEKVKAVANATDRYRKREGLLKKYMLVLRLCKTQEDLDKMDLFLDIFTKYVLMIPQAVYLMALCIRNLEISGDDVGIVDIPFVPKYDTPLDISEHGKQVAEKYKDRAADYTAALQVCKSVEDVRRFDDILCELTRHLCLNEALLLGAAMILRVVELSTPPLSEPSVDETSVSTLDTTTM